MNVALRKPMTLPEFLAWEEKQEPRYEFDGFQPVAMTGGTVEHEAIGYTACARYCSTDFKENRAGRGDRRSKSRSRDASAIPTPSRAAPRWAAAKRSSPSRLWCSRC